MDESLAANRWLTNGRPANTAPAAETAPGGDSSTTDRQPTDRVAEVVAVFAALGVRRGDRVLLQLREGRRCTQAVVGMLELGLIPLQVDPALSPRAVVAVATESGARLVLASPQGIRALAHLAAEPPVPVPVDGPDGPWAAVLRLG